MIVAEPAKFDPTEPYDAMLKDFVYQAGILTAELALVGKQIDTLSTRSGDLFRQLEEVKAKILTLNEANKKVRGQ
jgi:hypothetical protein